MFFNRMKELRKDLVHFHNIMALNKKPDACPLVGRAFNLSTFHLPAVPTS